MEPRIELDNAKINQALERLRSLSKGHAAPAMREIGRMLQTSTKLRFRDQRAPDGTPWRKVKRGGQALRKDGHLFDSILFMADQRQVEVGTNKIYAKVHQFGIDQDVTVNAHTRLVHQVFGRKLRTAVYANVKTFTRRMKIHARPFLGFSSQDEDDILEILGEHITRLANRR